MLFDTENLFSEEQALTASAASTNVVDFGTSNGDPSFATPKPLVIQVVDDFVAASSSGLTAITVTVQTSVDEAFTTPINLASSGAIPIASLKAGYKFPINFLPKGAKQYNRLNYTLAGTATAGKITAGLVAAADNSYQDYKE
jgi:hypothetical protein